MLAASDQARSQALEQHGCHVSHVTAQLRCRSIRLPMRPHRSNQRHGSAPERSGGGYHRLLYLQWSSRGQVSSVDAEVVFQHCRQGVIIST